jgi:hypothetical protein
MKKGDIERVERTILRVRGQNVMVDSDLADLYGVHVKVLNQAVRRNRKRFPSDFMFQLTMEESRSLRSQTVTLKSARGRHPKYLPLAFTEQGVAMLSSVLRSPRALAVNVEIMRAFVQLRRLLGSHAELARKLDALEHKYDGQFAAVFQAIRELMAPPKPSSRRIGFAPRHA